jgi:hypothetical protein
MLYRIDVYIYIHTQVPPLLSLQDFKPLWQINAIKSRALSRIKIEEIYKVSAIVTWFRLPVHVLRIYIIRNKSMDFNIASHERR